MAFTGTTVELPIGQAGLSGNRNHAELTPAHLVVAQNVSYWSGLLQRESGATLLTPEPLGGAITSGLTWLGGTRTLVTVTAGDGTSVMRKDDGSGSFPVTLATGLLPFDLLPTHILGGQETPGQPVKVFCALSPNPPRQVIGDGATADLLPDLPTEMGAGVAGFCLHDGRMWAFGARTDPHRGFYSSPTDHSEYRAANGGGSTNVYPGEGERVVAALSFKGTLILWKHPGGIYAIDTSAVDPVQWRTTRISAYIGTRGPGCVTMLDSDVIFFDTVGNVQLLSGITEYGHLGTANITRAYDLAAPLRAEFTPARFAFTTVQFSPARNEVHLTLCTRGQPWEDRRLVIDLNRPGIYRHRFVTRDSCPSLWLRPDDEQSVRPVVGGSDGRIWLLDQPGVQRTGPGWIADDPAPSAAFTPQMDLGRPTQRKNGKFIEIVSTMDARAAFIIEVYWDSVLRQRIDFNTNPPGWPLGPHPTPFTLDTSWLAESKAVIRRARLIGSGRLLQLRITSTGAGQDFTLARVFVAGAPSDEREPSARTPTGSRAPAGARTVGRGSAGAPWR